MQEDSMLKHRKEVIALLPAPYGQDCPLILLLIIAFNFSEQVLHFHETRALSLVKNLKRIILHFFPYSILLL